MNRVPEARLGAASVVVVGGGVIGTSIAFHLAEAGVPDVVLVERGELGSGSTCKAAGGIRAQFSDELNIVLGARSLVAFGEFGRRPGQNIDLHRSGYLFLLSSEEELVSFTRCVELQNTLGVPSRIIDVAEAARLSPIVDTTGLVAAAYSPDDGHCAPEAVVLGYATAARRRGARLMTHTELLDIETAGGEVRAVRTSGGRIETPAVICAAGAWSRAIGELAGVDLPITPYRREVVFTEPIPELPAELTFTIDFASSFYFHREGLGLLLGMSDPDQEPGFLLDRSSAWLDRLGTVIARRVPRLLDVGLTSGWAGLYEVTPDRNALIGSAGGGFLYAAGFSGHGFLQAPAVGEVVRDLYLGQAPFVDVSSLGADRFATDRIRPEVNCV